MFRCGKIGKDEPLAASLAVVYSFSPVCFGHNARTLRGFGGVRLEPLKGKFLMRLQCPPPPLHECIYTLLPHPDSVYSPICFFSCLTSLLCPDVDSLFISPPGVLPSCLHPSISLCRSFLFFFGSASSRLLQYMCRAGTSFRHELTKPPQNPSWFYVP